jgi:hypothetical protein
VYILQSLQHLFEIETADRLRESTLSNKVEKIASFYNLKNYVCNWDLGAVIFHFYSFFSEIKNFYQVRVLKFLIDFNFLSESLEKMIGVLAPRHIKNLDRKQLALVIGGELDFSKSSFA